MSKYVADFETSVYEGQKNTEVWAAAIVDIDSDNTYSSVSVLRSLDDFISYCVTLEGDADIYFHNLKFDGSFILDWLLKCGQYDDITEEQYTMREIKRIGGYHFCYMISDMGQWYTLTIIHDGKIIRFLDSLKLLPFSVKAIGESFKTEHRKTSIEYTGERHANGYISPEEEEYIKNDVLVVKEALQKMFADGHDAMTIGSCCMKEYKSMTWHDSREYRNVFPDLTEINCPFAPFSNADEYIRKSYKGGWCYLIPEKAGKRYIGTGTTCDVNSLYPSVMHSMSGNVYPYGKPCWFQKQIPERVFEKNQQGQNKFVFFVRVRCNFDIKPGTLPTIQIKGTPFYKGNEWLTSSKIEYKGKQFDKYIDFDNNIIEHKPEMTLTGRDYELLLSHYNVTGLEILDGCYFRAASGLFDAYIDKWAEIKMKEKGALRTEAKLFLNNLYGKLGTSPDSSFVVFELVNGAVKGRVVEQHDKKTGYVAAAACITSNARYFTITAAQANYDNFIYSDTDSIHCSCGPDEIVGAPEDPVKFCHWKYESCWDEAIFVRQKTYIEHITHDNREPIKPEYSVKCAGMGKDAQKKVTRMLRKRQITVEAFKPGFRIAGNLKAQRIDGGIILRDLEFKLR